MGKSLIDTINRIEYTMRQISSMNSNTQDGRIRIKQLNSRLASLRKEVGERIQGNVHIFELEVNGKPSKGLLTNMTKAEANYIYNNFDKIFPGESVKVISASCSPTFIK